MLRGVYDSLRQFRSWDDTVMWHFVPRESIDQGRYNFDMHVFFQKCAVAIPSMGDIMWELNTTLQDKNNIEILFCFLIGLLLIKQASYFDKINSILLKQKGL